MRNRTIVSSFFSGLLALIIGLVATWLASLAWPTPWTLGQAFVAVGIASFCAAFFVAFFGPR
jgi:hypothetical protein